MDLYIAQYYDLNMHLLSPIGLWPYDSKIHRRIRNAICWNFLHALCFMQLATVIDTQYTVHILFKNFSFLTASIGFITKYDTYYLHADDLKHLLEEMSMTWRLADCEEELDILRKYSIRGKFHAKNFALVVSPTAFATALVPFSSVFLNIVAPLNESRPLQMPIPMNFLFFDYRDHFYLAAGLMDFMILVGTFTFLATEGTMIVLLQHCCALYAITSFCDYTYRTFVTSYFVLEAIGVTCLSINLYRLSQTITHFSPLDEFLTSALLCVGTLLYMFYLHYFVQQVVNHSIKLFKSSYDTEWYDLPLPMQKLLLFFMLRAMKFYSFNYFGFFDGSVESFATVARVSVSYFMVLYSRQ